MAANLVAAIATLPADRVQDGLLQERLARIDTVTLSSDGAALMAIDGKPDANLRLRYGMPLEQAQSASFEAGTITLSTVINLGSGPASADCHRLDAAEHPSFPISTGTKHRRRR